ncbi:MAG TPA: xanthine dehydrogenase family protein subunit M [Chloroflexia bacterium]
MIPSTFDYSVPTTLAEAVALLGQNPDAKILAGGHSLIPLMKFRLAAPALLVDINRIEGLDYIREEDGRLAIGALTRESALDHSGLIREKYPLLADTVKMIADPLVRNMATVGGNLAHADPANDHPATMLAYGAQVVATGPNGERVIPIEGLFEGLFQTSLAHDEVLTEIRIPAPRPRSGGAYVKVERKVGDFATVAVAVQITLDEQGNCESVGIGLTNVGETPIKATQAEQALLGKPLDDANIHVAAQLAAEAAEPVGDQRGSEEYKRALVKTLMVRALRKAAQRATGEGA